MRYLKTSDKTDFVIPIGEQFDIMWAMGNYTNNTYQTTASGKSKM